MGGNNVTRLFRRMKSQLDKIGEFSDIEWSQSFFFHFRRERGAIKREEDVASRELFRFVRIYQSCLVCAFKSANGKNQFGL